MGSRLRDKRTGWEELPGHPVKDWQYEVQNGDTRRGYADWVAGRVEVARDAGDEVCLVCGGFVTKGECCGSAQCEEYDDQLSAVANEISGQWYVTQEDVGDGPIGLREEFQLHTTNGTGRVVETFQGFLQEQPGAAYRKAEGYLRERIANGETPCRNCDEIYPQGGDGYNGRCPSCADKAESEGRASE